MMESVLKDDFGRPDFVSVDDLRRNLSSSFKECSHFQDSADTEKEHLKVYLRIRPFSEAETENGESQDCVAIQPPETVVLKPPLSSLPVRLSDKSVPVTAQRFQFSQVYSPEATQKEIFDGTVRNLVKDVLEGQNSLVFTYGVTNAGKTFTFLGPDTNPGILPQSLNMIFSSLEGHVFTQMCLKPQRCRDFIRLTREEQTDEAVGKRSLLKLYKENNTSCQSLKMDSEDGSTLCDVSSTANDQSLAVDRDMNFKFSVWVSFCEIYNENIHDLLEQQPSNASRRANLRLCQDVKGNSFIKDLKWVQVNSADEAIKVMKIGKRNQSISSTKLNLLSSRSHSIFSVRILKLELEDLRIPRVESVSELALCDLAGSERCAKTQNKGDRLKEAGNINTSLLSLGKCINALRNNQQARQHVPFRESKLTHYLQGYFTGRGRACMIVNINQCASMYDETINVLRFSAIAQKVVVLTTKSVPLVVKRSAREVSFIINNVDRREKRRSSLVRWDPNLEDGQENPDSKEDEDEDEEDSEMEDTILDTEDEGKETILLDKDVYEAQLQLMEEIQQQLRKEKAKNLTLESSVRDEVAKEFFELISQMQEDYSERICRERQLTEERCDRRLDILKKLVGKTAAESCHEDSDISKQEEEGQVSLDSILDSMSWDLKGIRQDAVDAQSCLVTSDHRSSVSVQELEKKVKELSERLGDTQNQLSLRTQELETHRQNTDELQEIKKALESSKQREMSVSEMCKQKDEIILKLQTTLEQHVENSTQDRILYESVQKEMVHLKSHCTCSEQLPSSRTETRKRRPEGEGLDGQPPLKKGIQEGNVDDQCSDSAHLEVKGHLECGPAEARQIDNQSTDQEESHTVDICIKSSNSKLEEKPEEIPKKKEIGLGSLKTKQTTATEKNTELLKGVYQDLAAARSKIDRQEEEMGEKNKLIKALKQELTVLKQEATRLSLLQRDIELCRAELTAARQQCADTQQESHRKDERLRVLEEQFQTKTPLKISAYDYNLKKLNSDLQAEALHAVVAKSEEKEKMEPEELEQTPAVCVNINEGLVSQNALGFRSKTLPDMDSELAEREKAVVLKEAQLAALQRQVKESQERLEDEEMQAVQEARRREAERRRELLAVAEEAIAQKDAELHKRQDEITQLKEKVKAIESEMNTQAVDLHRREDDASDLREKLSDSKKQIQQVQKEISSMREAEKSLRLKLGDLEKTRAQLQKEIALKDRTIHQLKAERSSDLKSNELYQKACKDLQERERIMDDMRLALTEQEETQTQLDLELNHREAEIKELTRELMRLREEKPSQMNGSSSTLVSEEVLQARHDTAMTPDSLQLANEKHQAERKKWMEDKLVLIGQAKEAEDRRNQDMRRFADDRERHARQQAEMEVLSERLCAREKEMEQWRKERDTLVSALEVQLQKLISSNAQKDNQIKVLQSSKTPQTPKEVIQDGEVEALRAQLASKEVEIQRLQAQLTGNTFRRNSSTQTTDAALSDTEPLKSGMLKHTREARGSVTSQGSSGSCSVVLDSSQISTDAGRRSRFPRPELEISFSPLQPDRFALRRQGEDSAVTVKITRPTRKRKSGEIEKDGVESENIRNTRSRNPHCLLTHQEETSHSPESIPRGKKEKPLQKIGDFLQGSPTFFGSKAKKIMGLMNGRSPDGGSSSLKLTSKRKNNRPEISFPMDIPAHQIVGRLAEEKESESLIKRRLRTRTGK